MDEMEKNRGCCGSLPARAPLASPYVPFQVQGPETFEARKGLIRGTLFPCLEFPFRDMVNTQEKSDTLTHQIQALGFALQELGLYLDTHGEDREAIELFSRYRELYQALCQRYETEIGPMRQMDGVQNGSYAWTTAPWPWEYAANKED